MDGTIVEYDRVGDYERDCPGKQAARREIQAFADPAGNLIWYSPGLPGRTINITAARTHHIVTVMCLADKAAYAGAGGTLQVSFKRHFGRPLPPRQAAVNSHA
ncbi:hypothetical protein [Streptomyces sp. 1222.5]|uniref:hypothetical protein n=1 Tax=Streptomyces sp. 1222.5 TaxID=1881026 RepID=UPI003EBE0A6E